MNFFKDCKTIEEAKKLYRELLKKNHPDIAGKKGKAITVEIIAEFNHFIDTFVSRSFDSYYEDKEEKPDAETVTPFQDVLKKIIDFDCEIEIIGYWIYCFNSFNVHAQLKEFGFWFSSKHKAWIFSGGNKIPFYSTKTLDEIREEKGNRKVKRSKTETGKKLRIAV
jgi:DnaJ-class molecular chaperone